jgi:WD40-like Beta Propeller Repeat
MRARRLMLGSLVWLCGVAGCLALGVAVAPAAVVHKYLSQITEVPAKGPHGEAVPAPGPLEEVDSLAADSGHVWLAEKSPAGFRVDEFDASSGAFVSQLPEVPGVGELRHGVAVGHATGEAVTYVVGEGSSGVVLAFGATGGLLGTWTGADTLGKSFGCITCNGEVSHVAVDNSAGLGDWAAGDVYVTDTANNVVDVFEPEAAGKEKLATELRGLSPSEPFSSPSAIAVSAFNGDVLVLDASGVNIFKPAALTGQYEFVGKLSGPPPSGSFGKIHNLAVDGSNGDIYVAEGGVVDQFSAIGVYLGQITGQGTPAGNFHTLQSVAVDPSTHRVFVGDYRVAEGGVVDVFGESLIVPDVTTGAASNAKPVGATLNGTVNPNGLAVTECVFVWGETTEFGHVAPCAETPGEIGSGASPVAVHVDIPGLQPDTTYHYRLQAGNANGTNPGEAFQDQEFTTTGPGVRSESVSSVTATSATLEASIDPHGAPTTYYFQYGTSTGYGSEVPAAPGSTLGSGEGAVEAGQHLQGLSVGMVYHYRVVAVSELAPGVFEAFDGPDQTFTTQVVGGAGTLPDGRSWEMVSPPDKHGAQIYAIGQYSGEGAVIQASAAGSAMSYVTDAPTEDRAQGYSNLLQVFSTRGPGGWGSRDIAPPHDTATGPSVGKGAEYRFFSEDLSLGVVQPFGPFTPSVSNEASEQTPFMHADSLNGDVNSPCVSSCFHPLVTGAAGYANVPSGTVFGEEAKCIKGNIICGPEFVGATPDLSHVVLQSGVALTSTPTGTNNSLYEWSGGKLTLVSLLPGGEVAGGPLLGFENSAVRHAISADGSRVVWSAEESGGSGRHLYVRDLVLGQGETVQLDAVQGGSGEGQVFPTFQIASSDGSRVFFTDEQALTKNSGAREKRSDLYECEVVVEGGVLKCRLSDLTPLHSGEPADVQGAVLGASEDGSYVYFVANGALPGSGAPVHGTCKRNEPGQVPVPEGLCNLYVWHDGVTSLVAVLSEGDEPDWQLESSLQGLTARVSSDGRRLAFMSERPLTGYDTTDARGFLREQIGTSEFRVVLDKEGKPVRAHDEEVYLYDAATGSTSCVSCNPTGARPVGVEYSKLGDGIAGGDRVWGNNWLAANIPGWTPYVGGYALYQSRFLSDSGRLFFNSSDALVPQDVNGTEDVYEFEPPGVGGCSSASVTFSVRSGGCVGLVSSGGSSEESGFLDASSTGADVFFLTSAKLLAQDFDSAVDVYDAHECSAGSPCISVPVAVPPVCDTGDACKPAPTPQPVVFGAPSSATFTGAGNVVLAGPKPVVRAKGLTRAQKLARALRVCRQKRQGGRRRGVCERRARARYAVKRSSKANAIGKGGR